MNMIQHVMNAVSEQARRTALVDCFETWDGSTDLEVIIQGLHDRLTALGQPVDGLYVERTGLTTISIHSEEQTLCDIHAFGTVGEYHVVWYIINPLSVSEETHMAKWLSNNFYHKR